MNSIKTAAPRQEPFSLAALLLRIIDTGIVIAGAALAFRIRFEEAQLPEFELALTVFVAAVSLALFPSFGCYQSWRGRSKHRLFSRIALAWLVTQIAGVVLVFMLHRTGSVSRLWAMYWTGITGGGLIFFRVAMYAVLRRLRREGMSLRQVAIVGDGLHCQRVLATIASSPGSGFRTAAVLALKSTFRPGTGDIEVFMEFQDFVRRVRARGIQELWLALPLSEEKTILRFVNEFRHELVNIRLIPDVQSMALFDGGLVDLIGTPAINLAASPLAPHALLKKEIFDKLFAFLLLIFLSPLLACIAIAVKLSSPGPVLFTQTRKGADGQTFKIYKFRSMRVHGNGAGGVRQAVRGDARVTRVGAFLRRTSLDELPQFINVLRGEMSVVGPRPHAIEHDDLYREIVNNYIHRYRIKPGITGWAQVNGFRGETDRVEKMQRRVEHDLYYIMNWSFALDMRIVFYTALRTLGDQNAY
ncbi:sugar transferase [Caballeronia calidae]|uniref:Sugar transferase n=1 Tax=Caballeronia calidae TaxID=1777139 RepID=A0A158BYQ8_9BURK|nr:undecaprenyl-phosphate glucose phosphotransferase [Caballeronia calidae]SAK75239.1 sugar transferase [Caballeronia calidae]